MAEVFLAVRPGLEGFEKTLAIKRIRPHLTTEEAFVKMFLNEAKLAAQLQHPNVVQIYDLGKINNSFYIAMEYVSGRDMSRVVPKAEKLGIQFPIEYAMAIAERVLDGLCYAHTKADDFGEPLHVVHRDITPENIMVAWNGNVKILDFGIAKATTQTDTTKAGEIKGKLSYMSPEQGMGKVLDERSDLFTLGVVLYEWITGYKLFTGENEMAILKSIIDGRIYPPSYFREDIPEPIEDVLMRALQKDREARYQSARDMQFDIQQWLHSAEFIPTSNHLANFMKQIFVDEIEHERAALAAAARERQRKTPPPIPAGSGTHDNGAMIGEAVGKAKVGGNGAAELVVVDSTVGANGERALTIHLTDEDHDRIKSAADRNGVSMDDMLRDLVKSSIKYL
jgi:eukaryotic-like serine/threonine-protein kinase